MMVRIRFTDANNILREEFRTITSGELRNLHQQVPTKGQIKGHGGDTLVSIEPWRESDGGIGAPRLWGRTSAFLRIR